MSTTTTLKAEKRTDSGKGVARKLRVNGRIPAVVYGQGDEGLLLSLDSHDTVYLFEKISIENTIVDLDVEGEKEPISTLVREVQVHPFRSEILHVDFYRIQKGVSLEVQIPLHLHGTAAGVKNQGGVLQQIEHDLPVSCIPSKIPDELTLDVSALEIGDSLSAADLVLPEGVELLLEPEATLVTVSAPRAEEEEADEEGLEEAPEPELVGAEEATDEESED